MNNSPDADLPMPDPNIQTDAGEANVLSGEVRVPQTFALPDGSVPPVVSEYRRAIPGYDILSELGRGGMGVVYKARHVQLQRVVALKMILAAEHVRPSDRRRLLTEAAAIAQLRHPHIVQMFEAGEHEGLPYYTMEYIEGGNLASKLNGTPLPPSEAAQLVEHLAQAIDYAHQSGIIHRDLKPGNILLQKEEGGRMKDESKSDTFILHPSLSTLPKVTDFGLAKRLEESMEQTVTVAVVGTPSYMAPEQARADAKQIGPATDIYALGAILYECLTGRPPFLGPTPMDTVRQVLDAEPVVPRKLQPRVPRDLETICLKCLQKEIGKRYATAGALAEDLQCFRESRPIKARPVGWPERAAKWVRRYPAWAALFGVIGLVVTVGFPTILALWLAAVQARGEATAKAVEERRAKQEAVQERDTANQLRKDAEEREARLALDRGLSLCEQGEIGRGLLWLTRGLERVPRSSDPGLERAIRVNLADWSSQLSRPIHVLPHPRVEVRAVAFRPDGKVALVAAGLGVMQYDVATGQRADKSAMLVGFAQVTSLDYSPDGQTVLIGSGDGKARFWDPIACQTIGEPLILAGKDLWTVAFSRDGKKFLLSSGIPNAGGGVAQLFDTATRQPCSPRMQQKDLIFSAALSADGKSVLTGGRDSTAQRWDAATGKPLGSPMIHESPVTVVVFGPDEATALTGCRDGTVHFWDLEAGQRFGEPLRHLGDITAIVFSPNGRTLLTASRDDPARLWNVATRQPIGSPFWQESGTSAAAFSPDGTQCLVGGIDGTARFWRMPREKSLGPSLPHHTAVAKVAFATDGKVAMTGCFNGAYLWDTASGVRISGLRNNVAIHTAALAGDGRRAATSSWFGNVLVWDIANPPASYPEPAQPPIAMADPPWLMSFTPDHQRLLTVNTKSNREVQVWEVRTRQRLPMSFQHAVPISHLTISRDAKVLATSCRNATVYFWDLETGQEVRAPLTDVDSIHALALSPDGRTLATGSRDGTVRLWDLATGRLLGSTPFHSGAILDLAFSLDGKLLATGSADRTGRVWDLGTGIQLGLPLRHQDAVQAVAFSPDGRTVLTGARDRTAQLWHAPEPPLAGSVTEIKLWIELLAGMELDAAGVIRKLDEKSLDERRSLLAAPGHADFVRRVAGSDILP